MTDTYGHQKESHRVGTHAPHLWFGACFYSFYRFGTDNCPSVRASNQGTPTRTDTVPTPYNPWYTVEHGPLRTHFGTLRARSYGTPTCRQRWTTLSQPLHHRPYTLRASPTTVHYWLFQTKPTPASHLQPPKPPTDLSLVPTRGTVIDHVGPVRCRWYTGQLCTIRAVRPWYPFSPRPDPSITARTVHDVVAPRPVYDLLGPRITVSVHGWSVCQTSVIDPSGHQSTSESGLTVAMTDLVSGPSLNGYPWLDPLG